MRWSCVRFRPVLERLAWRSGTRSALVRSGVLVGAIVAILLFYRTFDLPTEGWAVISAALVFNAHANASWRLAGALVAANMVGASVSLLALYLGGSTIVSITVAMLLVGLICHLAYLDDGLRAAYICIAIVMVIDRFATLAAPIERVVSVAVGSLVGVAVSLLMEKIEVCAPSRRQRL
jgi:uncharacterized membrane protein YgaE (UPF0421/DUF939 family)